MADRSTLKQRIDSEFAAATQKMADLQKQKLEEFRGRQERLGKLEGLLADLQGIWRPKLEALAERFKDRVNVTPSVSATSRQGTFEFQSELARISLQLSAVTDDDARHLILQYDLAILPILMEYDKHSELRFPLDAIDRQAIADWIDDRIISFVRTYLSLHQNNYYLQEHLVQDPIAKVRFPKYAAGAKLEWKGETLYFLGEETLRQFEEQQKAANKSSGGS